MKHKKDNQSETIVVEIVLWIFLFGIIYMYAKGIF
jgi:hypothetical protein